MESFCALCHWTVKSDEIGHIVTLIQSAKKYDCELRTAEVQSHDYTRAGYIYCGLVVKASSQDTLDKFLSDATKLSGFEHWSPISSAQHDQLTQILGRDKVTLQEYAETINFNRFIDGLRGVAEANQELQRLLDEGTPLYFACNWVVPANVERRSARETTHYKHWSEELEESVFYDAVVASRPLGIGRELRMGRSFQDKDGMFVQVLVMRVFGVDEIAKYKSAVQQIISGEWISVGEVEYLDATPLTGKIFLDLNKSLKQMSAQNAENTK